MKMLRVLICLIAFFFSFRVIAMAQKKGSNTRKEDTTRRSAWLDSLFAEAHRNWIYKVDQRPTEKNARITYELQSRRIYPSRDAWEIIRRLNPWLDTVKGTIPVSRSIRMPKFPWLKISQKRKLRKSFNERNVADYAAKKKFDSLAYVFYSLFPQFTASYQKHYSKENSSISANGNFSDSLETFRYKLIPYLETNSRPVCKAKMEYLNSNLAALIKEMEHFSYNVKMHGGVIENTIRDFFASTGFAVITGSYRNNKPQHFASMASYNPTGHFYEMNAPKDLYVDDDIALKCRIYIYDRNAKPIKRRFEVYMAPYVTTYNLYDCRDTVAYLTSRGDYVEDRASTGALVIANNSNWAIYLKDSQLGYHTYLVPMKYNYQTISGGGLEENEYFRICLLYKGN